MSKKIILYNFGNLFGNNFYSVCEREGNLDSVEAIRIWTWVQIRISDVMYSSHPNRNRIVSFPVAFNIVLAIDLEN